MKISDRLIAITDLETTGFDSVRQEIIEIGLVLVNQQTLEIKDFLDVKVQPEHLETADPESLKFNGYNAADWQNASTIKAAMLLYSAKTRDAIFCAYNIVFDWPFILEAFKKTGVDILFDPYHRFDLPSMVWGKLQNSGLERLKMDKVAEYFGIPEEPKPHQAFTGAMMAYEIYKRLVS